MLTEDQVIIAVATYLASQGYQIIQALNSRQKGDDIIATKPQSGVRLHIEAKGETSNVPTSRRYGSPFNPGQALHHVSVAFYRAAKMQQQAGPGEVWRVGIALPDEASHRKRIDDIQSALHKLEIAVFWVAGDGQVSVVSSWKI